MAIELEFRVQELEARVDWIETYLGRLTAKPVSQVPPPPILKSTTEIAHCRVCGKAILGPSGSLCADCARRSAQSAAPPMPKVTFTNGEPKRASDDTEFFLGARVLPRVGAVLVLLGLAFFAGWAYTNGLITPWLAFLGEVGASVAFLALGFGLGRTKEQFGEVLKAIGSAGLFTSFAAGHLFHHVFNAEAMLGGCLLLSVANMAYAVQGKSKTFWGLGLAGGLISAFLPLHQNQVSVSETLLSLVIGSALITAGAQKWLKAVAGTWLAYIMCQLPMVQSTLPWVTRVAHLEGISLLAILVYARAFLEGNSFDRKATAPKLFGIGAGLLGFYVQSGPMGSLHVSILGFAIACSAFFFASKQGLQRSLLFTGAALLLVLAPLGLTIWHTSAVMIGLAIGLLIAEARFKKVELTWLAAFEIFAAAGMALARYDAIPKNHHVVLNAVMLVSLIPLALSFRRHCEEDSPVFFATGFAGFYFSSAIGVLLDNGNLPFGMPLTIAWTGYGLSLLVLGLVAKLKDVRIAGMLILLVTLAKVVMYDMSSVELIAKVAVLTGLGVAMLIGGYLVIRLRSNGEDR